MIRQRLVANFDRMTARKNYRLTASGKSFFSCRIARALERCGSDDLTLLNRRYFRSFEHVDSTASFFAEHFGDKRDRILRQADLIISGKISLLGHENVSFGDPIRWHYDPFSGTESPKRFWMDMDFLDFETVGDHKIIWELNRHQYMVVLGKAYFMSRDEKYVRAWMDQVDQWMCANHPKNGVNWTSCLEIAFRSIAWIWCLLLFKDSRLMDEEYHSRYMQFLFLNGLHIESNLSRYFSPNTHLTGEALGLMYLGLLFQETKEGMRWLKKSIDVLSNELEAQILPDGVYYEHASYYHRYTVDIYLHMYVLMTRNSLPLPPSLAQKLLLLLDFLAKSQKPDGKTPLFGDDDGGKLMYLNDDAYDDFRSSLSTGAVIFQQPNYKWLSGGFNEETLWLLGSEAFDVYRALNAAEPEETSAAFPVAGYFIMRDSWRKDASYMFIDCGSSGRGTGCHAHDDRLSIQACMGGKNFLIDPGTFTYTTSRELRDYFRSSLAHNTFSADGISQSKPGGSFSWSSISIPIGHTWIAHGDFDFFSGAGVSYRYLRKPIAHNRDILFIKRIGTWIILDSIACEHNHDISIRFHFASIKASICDNKFMVSAAEGPHGVISIYSDPPAVLSVEEDIRSPVYSICEAAKTGVCFIPNTASSSVVALLAPAGESRDWRCSFEEGTATIRSSIGEQEGGDFIWINQKRAFMVVCVGLHSDFRWIWKRIDAQSGATRYVCVDGKNIALEGICTLAFEPRADHAIIDCMERNVIIELPAGTSCSHELHDRGISLFVNGVRESGERDR